MVGNSNTIFRKEARGRYKNLLLDCISLLENRTLSRKKLTELTEIFKNIIRHLSLLAPNREPDKEDKEIMHMMANILATQIKRGESQIERVRFAKIKGTKTNGIH